MACPKCSCIKAILVFINTYEVTLDENNNPISILKSQKKENLTCDNCGTILNATQTRKVNYEESYESNNHKGV